MGGAVMRHPPSIRHELNEACGGGARWPTSKNAFDGRREAFLLCRLATRASLPCATTFPLPRRGRGEGSSFEDDEEALKLSHSDSSAGCLEELMEAKWKGGAWGLRVDAGAGVVDGGGEAGGEGGGELIFRSVQATISG
jgi:hypothetical protein